MKLTKYKNLIPLIVLVIVLAAVPLTLVLTKSRQENRQRASAATSISLVPTVTTVSPNQSFVVNANINTGGEYVSGVTLTVKYDPTKVQATSVNKPTTNAFLPNQELVNINNTTGVATITLLSGPVTSIAPGATPGTYSGGQKSGTGTLATITFTAIAPASVPVPITFDTAYTQAAALNAAGNVIPVNGYVNTQITIIQPSPTPVATPSPTPVATPSPTPRATPSPTPVATPSPTPVATPSPTPVATPSPTPRATPSPTPVATPSPTPRATPSPTPVATPSPTPRATPSPTPVATPSPTPRATPSPTPVATPSPTPVVTPTPTPIPASLNLQVRLEGIFNQQLGPVSMSISVRKLDETVVWPTTGTETNVLMTPNANGIYTHSATPIQVPAGTYKIYIKSPQTLRGCFNQDALGNCIGVTVISGVNTLDLTAKPLAAGDINGDNKVDIYDYDSMIIQFGCTATITPAGKNCSVMSADLDKSGKVDIFDYNYLVGNFAKIGK